MKTKSSFLLGIARLLETFVCSTASRIPSIFTETREEANGGRAGKPRATKVSWLDCHHGCPRAIPSASDPCAEAAEAAEISLLCYT